MLGRGSNIYRDSSDIYSSNSHHSVLNNYIYIVPSYFLLCVVIPLDYFYIHFRLTHLFSLFSRYYWMAVIYLVILFDRILDNLLIIKLDIQCTYDKLSVFPHIV